MSFQPDLQGRPAPRGRVAELGDGITFWGGIDTHRLLPQGTPAEVRAEVRRTFELMGAGGGWVLSWVRNSQPDVPPENVLAMLEAGRGCRTR